MSESKEYVRTFNIFNTLSDGIYISDASGKTLWLNDASERIIGRKREELIGRNVRELENEKVFYPSVTRLTLEKQRTVSTVQTSKNGQKHLVTGNLLKSPNGDIELVVVHSRDITEAVRTSLQLEETEALLRKYSQELRKMKMLVKSSEPSSDLVGKSKRFRELLDLCERVASVDTTVLLTGETGVGKSTVAQFIHQLSHRNKQPFVEINCSTIPETLLESELFGYEKGTFTGASRTGKTGLVETAEKGTLFLDEIGELPLSIQPKLLKLLQDKTYLPLGSTKPKTADIRIIAATNQNLEKLVRENRFRTDLFYRLNVLPIHIPPLRERKDDIVHLAQSFLNKFNSIYGSNKTFSPQAYDVLQNYDWPGNIRELENLVERVIITSPQQEISANDLPDSLKKASPLAWIKQDAHGCETLPQLLESIEKEWIQRALRKHGSTRKAAKALGMTQSAIMRRMKKYGLNR